MTRLSRLLRRTAGLLQSVGYGRSCRPEPDGGADGEADERGTRSEADLLLEEEMTPRSFLHHLVERAGGRTRQKHLVAESQLPESTVSRLLTDLEAEEHLVRHRVGRENVVCLPGDEPVHFDPETAASATVEPHEAGERAE
ncbi:helix-turn-helix transcriptional regulator [Halobium salinum]|uniref:Helix-turn-helix transcriptional regulator n=1 Tax=Halobium salinum TaxID=1364940 RepID=A0ABD5P9S7_9EURY|nr:hypothetical protein [Halobium salinum]